jgi:hypothetical protein
VNFLLIDSFNLTSGRWRLLLCLVCFSEFVMKRSILFTTNKRKENVYCALRSRISKFLNKFLQQSLQLLPIIIPIALFCILNIFLTRGKAPPKYNCMSHNWVEENNEPLPVLNKTYVLMHLSTQNAVLNLFKSKSVLFLQDNIWSTIKPRNFV